MGRRAALITVLVTLAIAWGSLGAVLGTGTTPKLGLDLQGGFAVVLEAPEGTDPGVLDKAVEVMTRRIEALGGVQEPVLKIVDDRNIQVELPGVTDRERARSAVGTTVGPSSRSEQLRAVSPAGGKPIAVDRGPLRTRTDQDWRYLISPS